MKVFLYARQESCFWHDAASIFVCKAGILPALGVASTLRWDKSKAPALQTAKNRNVKMNTGYKISEQKTLCRTGQVSCF
ncbi:MAG: hypothetical protein LBG45_04860, partial [Dysgonamonadaceae bacterium]|nr:hypothetical protein [Dysgonamonadaceae bacterium]